MSSSSGPTNLPNAPAKNVSILASTVPTVSNYCQAACEHCHQTPTARNGSLPLENQQEPARNLKCKALRQVLRNPSLSIRDRCRSESMDVLGISMLCTLCLHAFHVWLTQIFEAVRNNIKNWWWEGWSFMQDIPSRNDVDACVEALSNKSKSL